MTAAELAFRSLAEVARALRAGTISAADLTAAILARIETHDPQLKAFITVDAEGARARARAADDARRRGRATGALHGVPYAVKDIFQTRGLRTTAGSRVLADWLPDEDAAVVTRMDAAGAILVGKTNLHEFCHGATGENPHFGTARNPWDQTRLAGGSSSGSAVAVAAGLVHAALGSDVGGSVRVPAALCGTLGLKPTYGLISCHGAVPYCWSLDHVGIFARTAADVALVLEAVAGPDPGDSGAAPVSVPAYGAEMAGGIEGLRIGLPDAFFFDHLDAEIEAAARRAVAVWRAKGASVRTVRLPPLEHARTVSLLIQMPELLSYHARYLPERAALYGDDLRAGLATGQFVLAEHYVRAKRLVETYRRAVDAVFEAVDVLVTPTCPIVAPTLGTARVATGGIEEVLGNALTRFTGLFNLTGHPALSLPAGLHSTGLPMAVQVVGPHFEEARLLKLGRLLETEKTMPAQPPGLG